ncbi:MAG: 5-formyltetrahydrofolate cyclo-ligase [Nitrospirae bacterium]|nr:5-formyltetrahydrofolate cyclo-ligase [Nitrospirota bacterium]MBI3595288.1 5-formyltetrahydrofolate cyclo-ligase [Nitrospirota bacterium]
MNKEGIRKHVLSIRQELSSEECRVRSRAIQTRLFNREEFRRAKNIHFYISFRKEVATWEMIEKALEMGKEVAVPFIKEDGSEIGISGIHNFKKDLHENRLGIKEPFGSSIRPVSPLSIDLWIIPGVAFDPFGNRIGYGKGYYDRLLVQRGKGLLTGLAFDFQLVESIPVETHDVRMNQIITEYRTLVMNEPDGIK